MAISSISNMRELLWFKKVEINHIEDGLNKTKVALGQGRTYLIVERIDGSCVAISENFLRKCRISMTKDTVDIFSPKELEIWYDYTVYATDPLTYTRDTPEEVTEAISRDLMSIYLDEPMEKCGKNTTIIDETGENTYGENDERVYYITQGE